MLSTSITSTTRMLTMFAWSKENNFGNNVNQISSLVNLIFPCAHIHELKILKHVNNSAKTSQDFFDLPPHFNDHRFITAKKRQFYFVQDKPAHHKMLINDFVLEFLYALFDPTEQSLVGTQEQK